MAIHSGTLSINEIEKMYNVGFSYAKNIVDKLEEIGYIKKNGEYSYYIIQTEQEIDNYIKLHKDELRPETYIKYGWRDDGNYTLKRKLQEKIFYAKLYIPLFAGRILFSIPQAILLLLVFICVFLDFTKGKYSFFCSIELLLFVYVFALIPANILFRIWQANRYCMSFKDFMVLPKNWLFKRWKDSRELKNIFRENNIKYQPQKYEDIFAQTTIILQEKLKLVSHYAELSNNAENENEFYQSINSCIKTLEWMTQFERFNRFFKESTPSQDIKKIKDNMDISIERFNKRMDSIQKKIFCDYDNMGGHDFEYFCADILKKNGFENVEVTRGSGDHGIDILAEKDGITYAIQCKRYDKPVNNSAIQQAIAGKGFYKKDIAVVLTNNRFTAQAKEEAAALGVKLWDRDKLNSMIEKANN